MALSKNEILMVLGIIVFIVVIIVIIRSAKEYESVEKVPQIESIDGREYPLSAFKSAQLSGSMSEPQFLGDILTLKQGDGFKFRTESINGSVTKGPADKWVLIVFRENNERQSIEYDSWGDLSYKLNQYMIASRYFIANLGGVEFHVGKVKHGPVRKIKSGNDDFEMDYHGY